MKEAAGEANMTVITIVLIAIVLAVGTIVVRGVLNNTKKSSACSSCGGSWHDGGCYKDETTSTEVPYDNCLSEMNSPTPTPTPTP